MKRRALTSFFPVASVLLALRSKGAPVPAEKWTAAGFGIAVHCWSFKEFTLFESIEMAAAAGAGGVELSPGQKIGGPHGNAKFGADMGDSLFEAVAGKLSDHGMAAYNFGVVPVSKDETEARKVFDLAKRFGLYGITTESIDAIDILEKLAAEYDVKVCFHNHPRPTRLWNPATIAAAIEGRHVNLGFCADIGHWISSRLDPLEVVKKHAPRIHSFHLKDREKAGEWSHDRPFGTGTVDLTAILDEARNHGFSGNVTIEYEHNWKANLLEIAQCTGFLKGHAQGKTRAGEV